MESVLRVAAKAENLARVRQFVVQAAAGLGAPRRAVEDLELAVDEAVSNIIMHGYGEGGGEVEVTVWREAGTLAVRLRDSAPLFDPTGAPEPDLSLPLEERPLGGLGIFLVRRLMDQVEYRPAPRGGNELILMKSVL